MNILFRFCRSLTTITILENIIFNVYTKEQLDKVNFMIIHTYIYHIRTYFYQIYLHVCLCVFIYIIIS